MLKWREEPGPTLHIHHLSVNLFYLYSVNAQSKVCPLAHFYSLRRQRFLGVGCTQCCCNSNHQVLLQTQKGLAILEIWVFVSRLISLSHTHKHTHTHTISFQNDQNPIFQVSGALISDLGAPTSICFLVYSSDSL